MIVRNDLLLIVGMTALYSLLVTLSFAPFEYPVAPWVALLPIYYVCDRNAHSTGMLVLAGFLCSLFVSIFALHWIMPTAELALGMNVYGSLFLFIVVVLIAAIKNIVLMVVLGFFFKQSKKGSIALNWLTVGFIGLFVDWVCPQFPFWSWGNLIADNLYLLQITEFTGIYGLTLLLFSASYYLYALAKRIGSNPRASYRTLWPGMFSFPLLLIACLVFGVIRINQIEKLTEDLPKVRVASIQTNSPLAQVERQEEIRDDVFAVIGKTIPELAEKAYVGAGEDLDLLILAEAVVPFSSTDHSDHTKNWGLYSEPFERTIQQTAIKYGVEIFLGEIAVRPGTDYLGNDNGQPTNSSVKYNQDGSRGQSYTKNILFPVGEYIPFVDVIDSLGLLSYLPQGFAQAQFHSGESKNMIPYGSDSSVGLIQDENNSDLFLPLICYEVIFPDYVRSFFTANASRLPGFIVNITQDGWFQQSIASHQHLELARVRSVETRRALIRSANSGISVMFGIDGLPVKPLQGPTFTKQFEKEIQVWDVPINHSQITAYVKYGNNWIWGVFGLLVIIHTSQFFLRRRSSEAELAFQAIPAECSNGRKNRA